MSFKRLLLFSCISVLLAACGGAANQKVEMSDFIFEPGNFTVQAGQTVELAVQNDGAVEHNFVILNKGVTVQERWDDSMNGEILFRLLNVSAATSVGASFEAPLEAGKYQFLCTVPSHFELGMHGELTVTE